MDLTWTWHLRDLTDPEILEHPEGNGVPVKQNPVRKVFKVSGKSGKNYFVKIEKKTGFLNLLRTRFCSKARAEFESALLLENAEIPCAKYVAWGTRGAESCVISEALDGYISSLEYFYRHVLNEPCAGENYLESMAGLAGAFYRNALIHPDFHAGNVMIHAETGRAAVIDPYGIRRDAYREKDLAVLFSAFLFMKTVFPEEKIMSSLASAFTFSSERAEALFSLAERRNEKLILHEWPRREKQILSGSSKFCRTAGRRTIRSSPYFTPAEWKESALESKILPEEEARRIWLDSFRDFLLCRKKEKIPVITERLPDGRIRLFFILRESFLACSSCREQRF